MTTEVEAAKVCGKCGCDCARGCVEKFSASHELLQTLCYECDRGERYDAFERTGRLHTWLVTDATMVVFYADEARVRRDPGPHRLARALARRDPGPGAVLRVHVRAAARERVRGLPRRALLRAGSLARVSMGRRGLRPVVPGLQCEAHVRGSAAPDLTAPRAARERPARDGDYVVGDHEAEGAELDVGDGLAGVHGPVIAGRGCAVAQSSTGHFRP